MTTFIRILPILLFLFVLAVPGTAAHDSTPIPTITPYVPHGQPWASSYRSYRNTQLDAYLRANRAREQAIFTRMQATAHAQWTAQATPRTLPTPTPEPVVSHDTSLETWIVWAVRTEDVAGIQLGIMSGDYGYSWWKLD